MADSDTRPIAVRADDLQKILVEFASLAAATGDTAKGIDYRNRLLADLTAGTRNGLLTSIACPRCGRTSHHPTDVAEGYCGACHDWTGAPKGTDPTARTHDRLLVAGHCPMGCGNTLFVGSGGYITCSHLECPRPDAVATLLEDREVEHIVTIFPATFTIRHPLRERLDDALMTCDLHTHMAALDGPPAAPGRYRARQHDGRWTWEGITSEVADHG